MPSNLTLANDLIATVPLTFADSVGTLPPPATGGSVSVNEPSIVLAELASNDASVVIVPLMNGEAVVTYSNTNGDVSDTITVTVVDPTPTSVTFGTATLSPKLDQWKAGFSTDFDLSNNSLTATTNIVNSLSTIISTLSHTSGKFYFEQIVGPSGDVYCGLAPTTIANHALLGNTGIGFNSNGSWRFGGTFAPSGMGSIVNEKLGFAVDLDLGMIYVRKVSAPNIWYGDNGVADPITGAGGFAFTPFGAAMAIAFCTNGNGTFESSTLSASASQFTAAAPIGYPAWT
jgi:hypothetical protein